MLDGAGVRFLVVALERQEIVAVAHRLHEDERDVEHQRNDPGEDKLRGAEDGPGAVVATFGRISVSVVSAASTASAALAPAVKALLVMARAAPQQAEPDDPVAHDHHGGKHRVAREPRVSAGAAIMTETISATSMTVTARASTSVPNGSPVRCATTSA